MTIGVLTADIEIPGADSLKDKRQVLKSLIAHLRREFNIAAAEVDNHDIWRLATLGITTVANDGKFVHQVLDKVVDTIERDPRVSLGHYETELL